MAEEAAKEVSARETELVQALQTMKSALDSKDSELEAMALRETALKAKLDSWAAKQQELDALVRAIEKEKRQAPPTDALGREKFGTFRDETEDFRDRPNQY